MGAPVSIERRLFRLRGVIHLGGACFNLEAYASRPQNGAYANSAVESRCLQWLEKASSRTPNLKKIAELPGGTAPGTHQFAGMMDRGACFNSKAPVSIEGRVIHFGGAYFNLEAHV